MGAMASQITSLTIVYSTVYSGADQSKHQSFASLVFVWGIHRGSVNSPHKWPVTRKIFPFDDVIMGKRSLTLFLSELLLLMMNSMHFYTRQHSKCSTRSREISRHLEGCTSRNWIRTVLRILYPPRQCYGILWIIRKQFGSDRYSFSCFKIENGAFSAYRTPTVPTDNDDRI